MKRSLCFLHSVSAKPYIQNFCNSCKKNHLYTVLRCDFSCITNCPVTTLHLPRSLFSSSLSPACQLSVCLVKQGKGDMSKVAAVFFCFDHRFLEAGRVWHITRTYSMLSDTDRDERWMLGHKSKQNSTRCC